MFTITNPFSTRKYSLGKNVYFVMCFPNYTISKQVIYFNLFVSQEYRFVVTAKDGASEPRIATATVVINVTDIEDEEPIFHRTSYEASVPENVPNFLVTHVVVSKLACNGLKGLRHYTKCKKLQLKSI